ncbi:MAG: 1-acyl-sn-glycerol-3-phosphate acyltransferase [Planctomycetes bacterium]|nr:1-acyl-sn-glycerol-3-phosphate acyltransferase [Planctomycetota bacterium]
MTTNANTTEGPSSSSKIATDAKESSFFRICRKIFYRSSRTLARLFATIVCRLRVEGRHLMPDSGGAMLLSTHQSVMDPVLVGLCCNRFINYLARHTLFKNPLFSLLIRVLDAIEIDRERGGLAGLKEMLKRLKRGEAVLLFPEGTRTSDGCIGEIKPGFIPIARRSGVPLVPIAVVGAYECMPKGAKWLIPHPTAVVFGKPILANEYQELSDEELLARLSVSLHQLHARGSQLTLQSSH